MFQLLIDFVFWLLTKIAEIIFTPITMFITGIFPSLGNIITGVQNFLNTYVFDILKWFKMFAINTLAFPNELLSFIVAVFEVLITIHLTMLVYKGIMTIYQKFKP